MKLIKLKPVRLFSNKLEKGLEATLVVPVELLGVSDQDERQLPVRMRIFFRCPIQRSD